MEYRFLGHTGLKVSVIAFGSSLNQLEPNQQPRTTSLVKKALELGINFFDTAESYGAGEAERQMGTAFKELKVPREQIVVSVKLFWGSNRKKDPNDMGLSRKHILEGMKNSLKRLQLDYSDVILCHRFDEEVSLEETCRAMDQIIKQGLALYWGTSEWSAANIFEAFLICEKNQLTKPSFDQCQYNMIERQKMEVEFQRLFQHYGYGATVWWPLLCGLLTGKYNDNIPDNSRVKVLEAQPQVQRLLKLYFGDNKEEFFKKLKQLGELAKELGCSQAQLAMAWVIAYKYTSTAIVGSTKVEQLEEIVGAIEVQKKITPEVEGKINKILNNQPYPGLDPRAPQFFTAYPYHR